MSYDVAIRCLNELDFAGYTNWRLPTIQELLSLVDYENINAFSSLMRGGFLIQNGYYQSSTVCSNMPIYIWGFAFNTLSFRASKGRVPRLVLPVRDTKISTTVIDRQPEVETVWEEIN